jgi:hypothetical protein
MLTRKLLLAVMVVTVVSMAAGRILDDVPDAGEEGLLELLAVHKATNNVLEPLTVS